MKGLLLPLLLGAAISAGAADPKDYTPVNALLREHCVDCHSSADTEGGLILESHAALMKGGDSGPALAPGKASESLLVKFIEGFEVEGKKKIMPPGKREKLKPEQIAVIRAWIDAGAPAPTNDVPVGVAIPKIEPRVKPASSINAIAYHASKNLLALARPDAVELRSPETRAVVRKLPAAEGNTLAVAFGMDGSQLYVGGGLGGVGGEIRFYNVNDGKLTRTIQSHGDTVYSLAVSPDGKLLASGSYDQTIKIWNTETGAEVRTLSGHNGCVYAVAFRQDGKILASASADRTVKLWDVQTGERRDTLSQPLKEVFALAFSPDGKRLAAGGVDNRIRIWSISEKATETTNPLLLSTFAHEGAILRLAFSDDGQLLTSSADDKTVKLWEGEELKPKLSFEKQNDWPAALAYVGKAKALAVGRIDGGLELYSVESGQPLPLPMPEALSLKPRGIQTGISATVKISGKNLGAVTNAISNHDKLKVTLVEDGRTEQSVSIEARAENDLPRGSYEISLGSPRGQTAKLKLFVDHPTHVYDHEPSASEPAALPLVFWGAHEKAGAVDSFEFNAEANTTLVFEGSARSLGSKAQLVLTLKDATGKTIAVARKFDASPDPLLAHHFTAAGRYTLEASELTPAGSAEHFYRVTAGALPFVTGAYPLAAKVGVESAFTLIGHNLGTNTTVKFAPTREGEFELPLKDMTLRSKGAIKLLATSGEALAEQEPNNGISESASLKIGSVVSGSFAKQGDADVYSFEAAAGQRLILETHAERLGSPADTRIEILGKDGKPVERLLLQAVRDSAVTFRPMDSVQPGVRLVNWEEMDLREYIYMQGDVMRKFRMPQGPDSDSLMFTLNGKRRAYFDTTATAHALDEPAYVVVPHAPGAKLPSNGLPVFPVHFENDDAGERDRGADSKLHFTAPAAGIYYARVTEARNAHGERHAYALNLREARPDFAVTLNPREMTIPEGSGQSFTVSAQRFDGFEEAIRVDVENMPAGFVISTPVIIEAGHTEARGTIVALPGAKNSTSAIKLHASARIDGAETRKEVAGFTKLNVGAKPKLLVTMLPAQPEAKAVAAGAVMSTNEPLTIIIAPGSTVPAMLKVERNGYDDLITFSVDNLPHGVIVDNIGLNGVLIPKGENEREIFITAAKWVEEMDRLCFAIESQAGRQTSRPVMLKVRRGGRSDRQISQITAD
ncbi:MAG TPA: c-type cytochrome domain-containing protein [Methylomirabilota bacterium]|nr:c-type cytochrome domain-containing protein [Methylomirabilota bacterium]